MQEQQARQHEIQTVKEEILKKDQEILSLESQLKEAEKLLVSLSKRCYEDLKMISSPCCAFKSLFMFFYKFHIRCHKL